MSQTESMQIFLSYGRADVYPKGTTNAVEQAKHFPIVEKVYHHLKKLGHKPWFDKEDLTADVSFQDSINRAVEQSTYMLLFIGKHAMQSEWCAREWKHALKHCVPIVPILLEGDWGDDDIQATYPSRILMTDGINPRGDDGALDDTFLLNKAIQAIKHLPAPLSTAYGARRLPRAYIERPQYLNALKNDLGVNDKSYHGSNIVGITSEQEVASLQGIGGIGKTTLATALCNDCDVRRSFDQIFFLVAGTITNEANPHSLMQLVGQHFKDDPAQYQTLQSAQMRMQFHLQGKRTLIVLDDVWHEGVIDAFDFANVDCRLLVTTRDKRLVKSAQAVDKLSEDEGLQLLATLFDMENPKPNELSEYHRTLIIQLEGHTLAINIAGRWLIENEDTQTVEDYLELLNSDEATLFDNLQVHGSDRNDNLARSLALTYTQLDETQQRFFRFLGIIAPNSILSRQDVIDLWGDKNAPKLIQTLLHFGLLTTFTNENGKKLQKYRWSHPLIRAYARKLLEQENEHDTTFATYAKWVTDKAEEINVLPMEKWNVELGDYYPHIDEVGDRLVVLWQGENQRDRITGLVSAFVWAIQTYVRERPYTYQHNEHTKLRGLNWLEMGIECYRLAEDIQSLDSVYHNITVIAS